jgi:hypothetical protein
MLYSDMHGFEQTTKEPTKKANSEMNQENSTTVQNAYLTFDFLDGRPCVSVCLF